MRIAVCDDLAECREEIKKRLQEYAEKTQTRFSINTFENGSEFLVSDVDYDIVFMDIYLGEQNGVDVAREYTAGKSADIIFVTSSRDFAVEAFSLGAVHYLVKPFSYDDFEVAMNRCLAIKQPTTQQTHLIINSKQGVTKIPTSDIIYIEVQNRICIIHTADREYLYNTTLELLSQELPEDMFFRIQRSFVVNLAHIESIHNNYVTLRGDVSVSIARNKFKMFKSVYQDYLINLTRGGTE